ncbi:hypothetical protein GMOD_00006054 [Pyrenophora seminiperda CCB06]|uniref:Uncharacterized protein n=1 Tax=Pyrenophora seminiperda CCB06 TaxID=1302712 RepID=A0A3M7M4A3_9PLEO|nr:hypothetical protein GMOD_00006054 [Pyrenophora seminiperda CCB06]
MVKLVGIV